MMSQTILHPNSSGISKRTYKHITFKKREEEHSYFYYFYYFYYYENDDNCAFFCRDIVAKICADDADERE